MNKIRACLLLTASIALSCPALAQSDLEAALIAQINSCGTVKVDAERLRCFDAVYAAANRSQAERIAIAKEDAKENFGLTASERKARDSSGLTIDDDDVAIDAKIASASIQDYAPSFIVLDNGQKWRTEPAARLRYKLREGAQVTIEKGGIGGYRLQIDGAKGFIRVERVD